MQQTKEGGAKGAKKGTKSVTNSGAVTSKSNVQQQQLQGYFNGKKAASMAPY